MMTALARSGSMVGALCTMWLVNHSDGNETSIIFVVNVALALKEKNSIFDFPWTSFPDGMKVRMKRKKEDIKPLENDHV